MTDTSATGPQTPWLSLRLTTGLSQREVERRLGWKTGHLSLIERGLPPSTARANELRAFYVSIQTEGTPDDAR